MEDQVNVPVAQRLDLEQIVGHDTDADAYSRMPISNFGMNMLKSMGWQEGKGIGKNPQNALPKPIEFIPNYERAGLGARKDMPAHLKKRKLNDKQPLVDENGKVTHRVEIGAAKPKKVERNSRVKIIEGKYKDLKGVITDINEGKKECYVELEINEELVKLDLSKVKLMETEQTEEYVVDFEKGETSEGDYNGRDSDREGSLGTDGSAKGEKKSSRKDDKKKKKKKDKREKKRLKWIETNIWVKVVSKKVRDGKLYEKKVYVTDILDEYSFSALDEKRNLVDELREKDVQTVMPKQNGLVKILVGENKGKVAVMLERDKKRNKIMVQLVETMEVEEYTQDECSMYEEKM